MTTDAVSTRGQPRTRWIAWLFIIGSAFSGSARRRITPRLWVCGSVPSHSLSAPCSSRRLAFLQYREAVGALPIAADPTRPPVLGLGPMKHHLASLCVAGRRHAWFELEHRECIPGINLDAGGRGPASVAT